MNSMKSISVSGIMTAQVIAVQPNLSGHNIKDYMNRSDLARFHKLEHFASREFDDMCEQFFDDRLPHQWWGDEEWHYFVNHPDRAFQALQPDLISFHMGNGDIEKNDDNIECGHENVVHEEWGNYQDKWGSDHLTYKGFGLQVSTCRCKDPQQRMCFHNHKDDGFEPTHYDGNTDCGLKSKLSYLPSTWGDLWKTTASLAADYFLSDIGGACAAHDQFYSICGESQWRTDMIFYNQKACGMRQQLREYHQTCTGSSSYMKWWNCNDFNVNVFMTMISDEPDYTYFGQSFVIPELFAQFKAYENAQHDYCKCMPNDTAEDVCHPRPKTEDGKFSFSDEEVKNGSSMDAESRFLKSIIV